MSFARIHLLSRSEPWYAGDNLTVACGHMVCHPVARGMIDGDDELMFTPVCRKCAEALKPARYLYAIVEAQEAINAEATCA